jgi:hypothetical protein
MFGSNRRRALCLWRYEHEAFVQESKAVVADAEVFNGQIRDFRGRMLAGFLFFRRQRERFTCSLFRLVLKSSGISATRAGGKIATRGGGTSATRRGHLYHQGRLGYMLLRWQRLPGGSHLLGLWWGWLVPGRHKLVVVCAVAAVFSKPKARVDEVDGFEALDIADHG